MTSRLEQYLGTSSLADFIGDAWGTHPRHVGTENPQRFEPLLCRRTVEAALKRGANAEIVTKGSKGWSVLRVDRPTLDDAFSLGGTVCISRIEEVVEEIALLCRAVKTSMPFLRDVTVNCYASPPGNGFSIHLDSQHTVILQALGSKRWRYGKQPLVEDPLHCIFPQYSRTEKDPSFSDWPIENDLETKTLQPGDVLYLPPGTAHQAEAETESIALTLTLVPHRRIDLFMTQLLGAFAYERGSSSTAYWRGELGPNSTASELRGEMEEMLSRAGELLDLPIADVTSDVVLELRNGRRIASYAADVDLRSPFLPSVEAGVTYQLVDAKTTVTADASRLSISTAGKCFYLPLDAEELMRSMLRSQVFSLEQAQSWADGIDSDDVLAFIRQLLLLGIIRVQPFAPSADPIAAGPQ